MQLAIVIMAAGKGTRLKTKRPKVLHEVGGKTLIRHVVDAARQIGPPEDITSSWATRRRGAGVGGQRGRAVH